MSIDRSARARRRSGRRAGDTGGLRALLREARSLPTLVLVAALLLVGLPAVAVAVPPQHLDLLGQDVAISARVPAPTLTGPAQLVLRGAAYDLRGVSVYGPVRPRVEIDALPVGLTTDVAAAADSVPVMLRELAEAAVTWYLWGAVAIVGVALVGSALVGGLRILYALRGAARAGAAEGGLVEFVGRHTGSLVRMTLVAVVVAIVSWGACGVAAYSGTVRGVQGIRSLSDLVGAGSITPTPVGPLVSDVTGVVLGGSTALGPRAPGAAVPDSVEQDGGQDADTACGRGAGSVAAELGRLTGVAVLDLSCAEATVEAGLRGGQQVGAVQVPPQVGRLRQVEDPGWVVVAVGPDDVRWNQLGPEAEFDLRLQLFEQQYAALLEDLASLPAEPQVVVVTLPGLFSEPVPADCPDLPGPAGQAVLTPQDAAVLDGRRDRLDEVLATGADVHGFAVATPRLSPLCTVPDDGLGPDLQGAGDPRPLAPTAVGTVRIAASVAAALGRARSLR